MIKPLCLDASPSPCRVCKLLHASQESRRTTLSPDTFTVAPRLVPLFIAHIAHPPSAHSRRLLDILGHRSFSVLRRVARVKARHAGGGTDSLERVASRVGTRHLVRVVQVRNVVLVILGVHASLRLVVTFLRERAPVVRAGAILAVPLGGRGEARAGVLVFEQRGGGLVTLFIENEGTGARERKGSTRMAGKEGDYVHRV